MRYLLIVLVCLAGFSSISSGQQNDPAIQFDEILHDFGNILEEDGKVTHKFMFTNTGNKPLIINNVRASCGCTSPDWTKQPVAAGERGFVQATFNPANRRSHFAKTISVYTNGSPRPIILTIKGEIVPRERTVAELYPKEIGGVRMKSNHLAFSTVFNDQVKEREMEFVNDSDEPLRVSFQNVPSHIELKVVPEVIRPGEKAKLVGNYDAEKANDWGFVHHRIHMLINGQHVDNNWFIISAKITENFGAMSEEEIASAPNIEMRERSYDFGKIKPGEKVEHDFVFKNTGESDLVIRKVRSTCGCTVVKPDKEVIKPGEESSVKAIFSTSAIGYSRKSVYIISNDPDNSEIRIVVSANVRN